MLLSLDLEEPKSPFQKIRDFGLFLDSEATLRVSTLNIHRILKDDELIVHNFFDLHVKHHLVERWIDFEKENLNSKERYL